MGEIESDILKTIPDQDLPKLAKIYDKSTNWAPQVASLIGLGIEWKTKNRTLITFMSPNNCWKEDGTFFALTQFPCTNPDLFIFTLDKTGKNLYDGLVQTKRLYSKKPTLIFSVHFNFVTILYKAIHTRQSDVVDDLPGIMYSIPKQQALDFIINVPMDVQVKKLDKSLAPAINSVWPHRQPDSEEYLKELIDLNGGYGVFAKSNDELLAWVIRNGLGQVGVLQTVDEHKRKGYGSLLVKILSMDIAKSGYNPYGTIVVHNKASRGMFEKLGFKNLGMCTYMYAMF